MPPPVDADAILDKLGKLVEAAKPAEPAKPVETPAAAPEIFTPEQTAALEQYDKDWPDVAKHEAIRRSGEYKQLLGYVFSEVEKKFGPLLEQVEALTGRTHLTDIRTTVPDYSDDLRQQVIDWTQKQPTYLQVAYDHVIKNGTVDEVKDLIDRYRQATGQAAPAAGAAIAGQPAAVPVRTNELSGAAKEAAAALAPVESKRSEVQQPGDPSNYEDAWKQAAKDLA